MTNILDALVFYTTYPGWHSFDSRDRATTNAIKSLEKRGYLEVVSDQARFIDKIAGISNQQNDRHGGAFNARNN